MDVVLKENLKTHISRLSGENFQAFTDFLFTKKYGSSFRALRHHRDKGCDGIIQNKMVIAVYGPENGRNTLASFKTKFSTDYQKYQENWSKLYPEFLFVYNSSPLLLKSFITSVSTSTEKYSSGIRRCLTISNTFE